MRPRDNQVNEMMAADIQYLQSVVKKMKSNECTDEDTYKLVHFPTLVNAVRQRDFKLLNQYIDEIAARAAAAMPPQLYKCLNGKYYFSKKNADEIKFENAHFIFFGNKHSRKVSGLNHSLVEIFRDDTTLVKKLYLEHDPDKAYPTGSFGRVKKGFKSPEDKPAHAVKRIQHPNANAQTKPFAYELRLIMRGAYFTRLLGRTGIAYQMRSKFYLLTDWHDGETLHFNRVNNKLLAIPFYQRFMMALNIIRDTAILHRHNLIHGDIKSMNVMLDGESAKLIDFDGTRLIDEAEKFYSQLTLFYLDQNLRDKFKFNFPISPLLDKKSDVYALAKTIAQFFPDLFCMTTSVESIDFITIDPHALVDPIMGMMAENSELRPASAEVVYHKFIKIGKSLGVLAQDYEASLGDIQPNIAHDLFMIEVEILETHSRIFNVIPKILEKRKKKREAESIKPENSDVVFIPELSEHMIHEGKSFQLISLMLRVVHGSGHDEATSEKYFIMHRLAEMVPLYNEIPDKKLISIAKLFFHFVMQRNSPGIKDETKGGAILCDLLNYSELTTISTFLFPGKDKITYENMREFVCGYNDVKMFSFFNKGNIVDKFYSANPTLADIGNTFTIERLHEGISYRSPKGNN